jgi:hypothetical protein
MIPKFTPENQYINAEESSFVRSWTTYLRAWNYLHAIPSAVTNEWRLS